MGLAWACPCTLVGFPGSLDRAGSVGFPGSMDCAGSVGFPGSLDRAGSGSGEKRQVAEKCCRKAYASGIASVTVTVKCGNQVDTVWQVWTGGCCSSCARSAWTRARRACLPYSAYVLPALTLAAVRGGPQHLPPADGGCWVGAGCAAPTTNEQVYAWVASWPLEGHLAQRHMRHLGHISRLPDASWTKFMNFVEPEGRDPLSDQLSC
eukprot:354031-Chlamydomonas_euryale.AAC.3